MCLLLPLRVSCRFEIEVQPFDLFEVLPATVCSVHATEKLKTTLNVGGAVPWLRLKYLSVEIKQDVALAFDSISDVTMNKQGSQLWTAAHLWDKVWACVWVRSEKEGRPVGKKSRVTDWKDSGQERRALCSSSSNCLFIVCVCVCHTGSWIQRPEFKAKVSRFCPEALLNVTDWLTYLYSTRSHLNEG